MFNHLYRNCLMSSIILLTINVNVILLTAANVGWTMLIMLRYYIQRKEKFTFILDVVNAIGVLAYIAAKFFFIPEMHTFSNAFILGIATSFTLLVIIYYIKYVIAERKAKNKNPNRTNS